MTWSGGHLAIVLPCHFRVARSALPTALDVYGRPSMIRVAVIDDHPFMAQVVGSVVGGIEGAEFVGLADSVDALLSGGGLPDIVVLGLRLRDGSSPVCNIRVLLDAGV